MNDLEAPRPSDEGIKQVLSSHRVTVGTTLAGIIRKNDSDLG